jgi:uncharacterized membrane protein YeaQ/YmgE (transglycosylase-associated protein family)
MADLTARTGGVMMDSDTIFAWVTMGICPGIFTGIVFPDIRFGQNVNIAIDVGTGLVGAFAAGWLGDKLGLVIGPGVVAEFVTSIVGAVLFVGVERMIRRAI